MVEVEVEAVDSRATKNLVGIRSHPWSVGGKNERPVFFSLADTDNRAGRLHAGHVSGTATQANPVATYH